ncbi:hypothetical protein SLAV_01560 [Streptomyces lavendulae subsp. lavendulae]|uniref:Uncharacterized protein n=1 Tax=Streptomyces lavendulae subsp. lavendulae TaxID=58340 RepID=A0A2K8P672_STRLA|nr:hypothetical protein SLAV_01560 [Streptomyces lavendulae subsp. lavendulae]
MPVLGFIVFTVGVVGIMVGSKLERGWDMWSRQQRIVCSLSFVLVIAGLATSRPA